MQTTKAGSAIILFLVGVVTGTRPCIGVAVNAMAGLHEFTMTESTNDHHEEPDFLWMADSSRRLQESSPFHVQQQPQPPPNTKEYISSTYSDNLAYRSQSHHFVLQKPSNAPYIMGRGSTYEIQLPGFYDILQGNATPTNAKDPILMQYAKPKQ